MKRSKLRILYLAILVMVVIVEVVTLVTDPTNYKLLVKGASLIVLYVLAITGVYRRHTVFDEMRYRQQYSDVLEGVFPQDRRARKMLMQAISLYNDNHFNAACKKLDRLAPQCVTAAEHCAVLLFRARCDSERGRYADAIRSYEEMLLHDSQSSRTWSNKGLCHVHAGQPEQAEECYRNAIRCNEENPYPYVNLAALLLKRGEEDEALEYAVKALLLDPSLTQAKEIAMAAQN